jgi:hypothetical protein
MMSHGRGRAAIHCEHGASVHATASDERLTNRAHVHVLSPQWGTLYELTKLDDAAFADAIERVDSSQRRAYDGRCGNGYTEAFMEDSNIIAAIIATGIIAKSKRVGAGKLPKVARAATEIYLETLKCLREAEGQRSTGPPESTKRESEKAKKKQQGAPTK